METCRGESIRPPSKRLSAGLVTLPLSGRWKPANWWNWLSGRGSTAFERLIINGSFVTSKSQPNDVDIVLLPRSGDLDQEAVSGLEPSAWPFLANPRRGGWGRFGTLGHGRFRDGSGRPRQGRCGGDLMTERSSRTATNKRRPSWQTWSAGWRKSNDAATFRPVAANRSAARTGK